MDDFFFVRVGFFPWLYFAVPSLGLQFVYCSVDDLSSPREFGKMKIKLVYDTKGEKKHTLTDLEVAAESVEPMDEEECDLVIW